MENVVKIYEEIETALESFQKEKAAVLKGNKSAARRSRKLTLELAKLYKTFRSLTLHDDSETETENA